MNIEEIKDNIINRREMHKTFAQLVKHTQKQLYWHIRKMVLCHEDSDDILQNTYIKAWKGLDNFRGDSSITTWMYRIATNETLTFLAQKRLDNVVSTDDLEEVMFSKLHADEYFDSDLLQKNLQKAILGLPEKQRLVFNMRYYDEMPYEQMSDILGTSVGALKASYHHAQKKVEESIKQSLDV